MFYCLIFHLNCVQCTDYNFSSSLNHPNIIQLKGMRKLSQNTIGLVQELANGSLHDVIHGIKLRSIKMDDWKINFSKEITSAMIYLNNRDPPIHHRDLKSKNVLVWIIQFPISTTISNSSFILDIVPTSTSRSSTASSHY